MAEINAIKISSDPNILTYISNKGIYTNSLNLIDHIHYTFNNNYFIVDEIDILKSNYSIIPEYKIQNNLFYPVKKINITLPFTTNKVIHYIKLPDTIEEVNINSSSNYELTINAPCKNIINSISENIIKNVIVREYNDIIFNNFIFKQNSSIINLSNLDNSYFIYPNIEITNIINKIEGIAPTEEYENLKIQQLIRERYFYDKENLCYIKQYNAITTTINNNKKLEGLIITIENNNYIIKSNNQLIKTISSNNLSLNKITLNYEYVYYVEDNKIIKLSLMDNTREEKIFNDVLFSHISLLRNKLFVINNNKIYYVELNNLILINIDYTHIKKFYDIIYFKQYLIIVVKDEHNDYSYNENHEQINNYVEYITLYYSYDGKYFQRQFLFNIPINENVYLTSNNNKLYLKVGNNNYEFMSFKEREYLLRI